MRSRSRTCAHHPSKPRRASLIRDKVVKFGMSTPTVRPASKTGIDRRNEEGGRRENERTRSVGRLNPAPSALGVGWQTDRLMTETGVRKSELGHGKEFYF